MFGEQPVKRDVVAVYRYARIRHVHIPPDARKLICLLAPAVAMIGAPRPDVVRHYAVRLYDKTGTDARRGIACPARTEETVGKQYALCAAAALYFEQKVAVGRIEQQPRNGYVFPGGYHTALPVCGHERGKPRAEHHRVVILNRERLFERIYARGKEQVLALFEHRIERSCAVALPCHIEVRKGYHPRFPALFGQVQPGAVSP